MKRTSLLFLGLLLFLGVSVSFAQSKKITGKVTSADDGSALPGVTVTIKGTGKGTQTDGSGAYSVEASSNQTLVFSFVGMSSKEVAVGNKSVIDVALSGDDKQLEQLVVVGYGTQSRKDMTSAISTVKGDALKSIPAQSVDQLLSGKAAGVNINIPNGLLNNPPVIRVRGFNSITSSSYPLIVVDGIIVFSQDNGSSGPGGIAQNPLSDINPNDIETIDILKDAAATAIYGSRAANGVLVITTKKGKAGKSTISYDGSTAWTKPFRLFDLLNASEYIMMKNEGEKNRADMAGQTYSPLFFENLDPSGKPYDTNWYDYVFTTGFQQNHNINVSGATPKTSYYFSGGYTNQDGFLKSNTFERKNARMNISHNVTDKIVFGANFNYSNAYSFSPNSGSLIGTNFNTGGLGRVPLVTAPNIPAYLPDGSYNINTSGSLANSPGNLLNKDRSGFYNPVVLIDLDKASAQSDRMLSNIYATINLTKDLSFRTDYGIDYQTIDSKTFNNPLHGDAASRKGLANNYLYKSQRWSWQNYLNYNKKFAEVHSVGGTLGTENMHTNRSMWSASRESLADPFFNVFEGDYTVNNNPPFNFLTENGFVSYFGRLTYDFSKRYYFTASLRRDGLSALAEGKKFGNFYGISGGWNLAEESFFKNLTQKVSTLKLRTSYGKVGNAGISDFASLSLYGFNVYGGTAATLAFSQAGNPDLKWETSTKLDIGLNYGFLNDKITGELTYYKNNIDGLILNSPLSPSMGVPGNSVAKNVGAMFNQGVEFAVNAHIINKGDFKWSSNFNIATQKNEVTALAEGNADIFGVTQLETANITRVGYSVGSLYAVETRGINPENGRRIFINKAGKEVQYSHAVGTGQSRWTYLDGSTAPAITVAADAKIMGITIPKFYGGWDNNFSYKKFDLNVSLVYAGGFYVYNGTKAGLHDQRFWNNEADILDRWTPDTKTTATWPKVIYGDNVSNGSSFPISNNIEKGDFIKCRNIALGYALPTSLTQKAKISSARIFGQVTNAFMLTKYTGTDPETSSNGNSNLAPGVDRNSIPQARTVSCGLSLTF